MQGDTNIRIYQLILRVNEASFVVAFRLYILPLSEFGDRIEDRSVDLEWKICVHARGSIIVLILVLQVCKLRLRLRLKLRPEAKILLLLS